MKNLSTKDFCKIAFVVGVGFTVGEYVGSIINGIPSGIFRGIIKHFADGGNKTAQKICKDIHIGYHDKTKKIKNKIGF